MKATLRFPLADPAFLNGVEEYQLRQNEQIAQFGVRAVVMAEKSYKAELSEFACTLSALGSTDKAGGASRRGVYLYDRQLATGKKNGYSFAISCDGSHYRIVAEPEAQGSGQRAFCSDESGTLRAAGDGKGATCVAKGEVVENPSRVSATTGVVPQQSSASGASSLPRRVRISQGVSQGLLVSKVQPVYPPEARAARVQGSVVMKAEINQAGDVESIDLVSGDPLLAQAAIDAVKQWKYKPYLLNGNAVNVETQVIVNFTLTER